MTSLSEVFGNLWGSIACAFGNHKWRGHPAIVASMYPALNAAGQVVGSWIPCHVAITRTAPVFLIDSADAPVNKPKAFESYFQPTSEERPGYTSCDLCGTRL